MKTRDTKDEAAKAARDALIAMHEGIAIGIMQQVEAMEEPGKCPPGLLLQMGAASQSAAALRSAEALEGIEAMVGMMATTSMLGGIGSLGATVDRLLAGLTPKEREVLRSNREGEDHAHTHFSDGCAATPEQHEGDDRRGTDGGR